MSTLNVQLAQIPLPSDIPAANYSVTDIPANTVVQLDTGNIVSNALPGIYGWGVALPATGGNPSFALGVTMETIKANGGVGRVRPCGTAVVTNDAQAAITAGTVVDASVSVAGAVRAHAAGKNSLGLALTSAAASEQLLVLVQPAVNA